MEAYICFLPLRTRSSLSALLLPFQIYTLALAWIMLHIKIIRISKLYKRTMYFILFHFYQVSEFSASTLSNSFSGSVLLLIRGLIVFRKRIRLGSRVHIRVRSYDHCSSHTQSRSEYLQACMQQVELRAPIIAGQDGRPSGLAYSIHQHSSIHPSTRQKEGNTNLSSPHPPCASVPLPRSII